MGSYSGLLKLFLDQFATGEGLRDVVALPLMLGAAPFHAMAPELMLSEVANTLWKLQRVDQLAGLDPQLLLLDARELVDRVEPDRHLQAEALALACHLNHPVYDCLYLALARREAAALISSDRRMGALAERVLP